MKKGEPESLKCPLCGAPQRQVVPAGVTQFRCRYCGGLVLVPPALGGGLARCPNHPEMLATGRCNDCGNGFCDDCLKVYEFASEHEKALLYLCNDCYRSRQGKKAERFTLTGIAFIMLGVILVLLLGVVNAGSLISGGFLVLLGFCLLAYGWWLGGETSEAGVAEKSPEGESASVNADAGGEFDVDDAFSRLLTYYVSHWGVGTGKALLDDEIRAYVYAGESYEDAIRKICKRQKKNL